MSGIGKIAFEHLKFNHANNHDNIVTIFFVTPKTKKIRVKNRYFGQKWSHFEKMCLL